MPGKVWIIGSGPMAQAYARVLADLRVDFMVVGRGETSASALREACGCHVITGGLDRFLALHPEPAVAAIVATGVEQLGTATLALIGSGVRRILVEKPGGLHEAEIDMVAQAVLLCDAQVYLGYNRRFYASTLKAKEFIQEDGGLMNLQFEFTEWGHVIEKLEKAPGVKEHWFLANSTHVVDLAFHLGGRPAQLQAFTAGHLPWHPLASIFAGAGVTESGALFSYQANWEAPGRWGVELLTRKRRIILRPMEKLVVQHIGSVEMQPCELDDRLDLSFKPGLHRQVTEFLSNQPSDALLTFPDQTRNVREIYSRMLAPGSGGPLPEPPR